MRRYVAVYVDDDEVEQYAEFLQSIFLIFHKKAKVEVRVEDTRMSVKLTNEVVFHDTEFEAVSEHPHIVDSGPITMTPTKSRSTNGG